MNGDWVYYACLSLTSLAALSVPYMLSTMPTTVEHYSAAVNGLTYALVMVSICMMLVVYNRDGPDA